MKVFLILLLFADNKNGNSIKTLKNHLSNIPSQDLSFLLERVNEAL